MKDKQDLIQEWIRIANEDMQAAKLLIQNDLGLYRTIAYHSQQYAEKMIKALLLKYDIPVKRTHNIDELLLLLEDHIVVSDEVFEYAVELSAYAVEIRYPDSCEPSKEEATAAFDIATKLVCALNT